MHRANFALSPHFSANLCKKRSAVFAIALALNPYVTKNLLAQSEIHTNYVALYDSGLGSNVVGLGDVDGDSVRDFAGQSSGAEANGLPALTVFSGKTGTILSHVQQPIPAGWQTGFGDALDGGADVDGDGHQDILIGAPYGSLSSSGFVSSNGAAYLARASDGVIFRIHKLEGSFGQSGFGWAVRFLDDLNGDNRPEYAVSAYPNVGSKYVVLFDGLTGAQLGSLMNSSTTGAWGVSITRIPDITGDGRDEFGVGAWLGSAPGKNGCGLIYIYEFVAGTIQLVKVLDGAVAGKTIGITVEIMGDIDGDGGPDLATNFGEEFAIFNIVTGQLIRVIHGFMPIYPVGRKIARTDDLDGDGINDVLATEWVFGPGAPYYAKLVAFSSATGERLYQYLNYTITQFTSSLFPDAIADLGDVDGDGLSDWLIGSQQFPDPFGPNGGMVRVLSRRPLYSRDDEISPTEGSTVSLDLNGGMLNAGRNYFILSSFTGTSGIPIGAATIPLHYDALTELAILYVNTPVFDQFSGVLDANGNAHATFDGTLIPPAAQGLTFTFAHVIYGGSGPFVTSNPHNVQINVLGTG